MKQIFLDPISTFNDKDNSHEITDKHSDKYFFLNQFAKEFPQK